MIGMAMEIAVKQKSQPEIRTRSRRAELETDRSIDEWNADEEKQ